MKIWIKLNNWESNEKLNEEISSMAQIKDFQMNYVKDIIKILIDIKKIKRIRKWELIK